MVRKNVLLSGTLVCVSKSGCYRKLNYKNLNQGCQRIDLFMTYKHKNAHTAQQCFLKQKITKLTKWLARGALWKAKLNHFAGSAFMNGRPEVEFYVEILNVVLKA